MAAVAYCRPCIDPQVRTCVDKRLRHITPLEIIRAVCAHYGVSYEELQRKGRKQVFVRPRFICYHLIRKHLPWLTLMNIGCLFGGLAAGRDHSTIIYGLESITNDLKYEVGLKETVDIIESLITCTSYTTDL